MAEPTCIGTTWKKFWESYWPRIIATFLVIGVILSPRRCEVWALLSTGPLNELGDFLAGVFTPAALGWLIYGYLLQSKELGLQREELKETRETFREQLQVMKSQAAAEGHQFRPNLFLRQGGIGTIRPLGLLNLGASARNLEVSCWEDGGSPEENEKIEKEVLDHDKEFPFSIPDAPASSSDSYSYFIEARFISERHERLYQRWEITFPYRIPAKIQQITTDGPEPLIEDSSAR